MASGVTPPTMATQTTDDGKWCGEEMGERN